MGGNCPERFDFEFYKAILRFNRKNRPKTKALLEKYKPDVIVFKNRRHAEEYLDSLSVSFVDTFPSREGFQG